MSGPSRRALAVSARAIGRPVAFRAYATGSPKHDSGSYREAPDSETPAPAFMRSKKKELSSAPLPMTQAPRFPVPADPFDNTEPVEAPKQYSETRVRFVRAAARLMGYNTKAVTAIRETGGMMKSIVMAIERDRTFWYDGQLGFRPLESLANTIKSAPCRPHIRPSSKSICSTCSRSCRGYGVSPDPR